MNARRKRTKKVAPAKSTRRQGRAPAAAPTAEPTPSEGGEEEIPEESMEEGLIVDQGDGMRVVRRIHRSPSEERETHELPDEPPRGWGDG